jgi:hypothetical protein
VYQTILTYIAMTTLVVAMVGLVVVFFWLIIRDIVETKG